MINDLSSVLPIRSLNLSNAHAVSSCDTKYDNEQLSTAEAKAAANDTKTNTKSIADTFCITNHDIISLLTEDYINKKGDLKQKYFAELKNGIINKDIPKKAYISKSDHTYVGDANKNNITVGLYLIVKKGQSRIVRDVDGRKSCRILPSTTSFAALPQNKEVTCVQRILKVKDGDTFDYLDCNGAIHTVRIAGIDTPEKGQPFANKAKEKLSTLLHSGQITLLRTAGVVTLSNV